MTKQIILGDEYDNKLRDILRSVLIRNGATELHQSWGVVGSQELETMQVELGSEKILIESETYIGLSITGSESVVDAIAAQVHQVVSDEGS